MAPGNSRNPSADRPIRTNRLIAFFGRHRHGSDPATLPAKSNSQQELIGLLLLAVFACMIAIVLWHHISISR